MSAPKPREFILPCGFCDYVNVFATVLVVNLYSDIEFTCRKCNRTQRMDGDKVWPTVIEKILSEGKDG